MEYDWGAWILPLVPLLLFGTVATLGYLYRTLVRPSVTPAWLPAK